MKVQAVSFCGDISKGKKEFEKLPLMKQVVLKSVEKYRQDCHFIYVTHDTEFAAQHPDAKIIWVKSFDGKNKWDYEELTDDILPDGLLLKRLGNRKNVLFIEGKDDSWDYKIYSKIY